MKKTKKISSTAYRVLLLLKLLNEDNFSIDELNTIMTQDPKISRSFSNEVILKYISTLRISGYKITKPCLANNYTYKLIKAPLQIKLNEEDLIALVSIGSFVSNMHQKMLQENVVKVRERLLRYMDDEQAKKLSLIREAFKTTNNTNTKFSKYAELMSKYEQYCIDDQKVTIKYKHPLEENEVRVTLEPKYLDYVSGDIYICGYNPIAGERLLINVDYVIDIKQLPVKSSNNYILSPVIFKLRGRLAKTYELHENEKITESDQECITVTSYIDYKDMLLCRLLKYGDLCEVIYPNSFREKISSILKDAIKNYET